MKKSDVQLLRRLMSSRTEQTAILFGTDTGKNLAVRYERAQRRESRISGEAKRRAALRPELARVLKKLGVE